MTALCRPKAIAQVHLKNILPQKKSDLKEPSRSLFWPCRQQKSVASQEGVGTQRAGSLNR
jgi:hypothetical protein